LWEIPVPRRATRLMLDRTSPEEIGRTLELALFHDAKLELEKLK
jgi:hypothetical protein